MPDTIDRASVFRQRRFLLAVTFAICAFHFLHATPADEFTIAAITFNHSASRVQIGIGLWLVWLWALARYRQYERTFRNDALFEHRQRVTTIVCVNAATQAIQEAVRAGKYECRGVNRDRNIEVSIPPEGTILPLVEADSWRLPNLTVRVFQSDGSWIWLQDGANCSFSASETIALQKQIEKRLIVDYPHFTDFKVPYGIALLALVAAMSTPIKF